MNRVRRALLLGMAGMPILACTPARAQSTQRNVKAKRVAFLLQGKASPQPTRNVAVFMATMSELGWVEGKSIVYERAYAEGDLARLPAVAAEIVARKPDLIHVSANPEALAALGATRSVPIVFATGLDPVDAGLVQSLARPGGNVTGVATLGSETAAKRMQFLKEVMPKLRRVGVVGIKSGPIVREVKTIETAAGAGVIVVPAWTEPGELEAAFGVLARERVEAVLLTQVFWFGQERERILGLAAKYRLPLAATRPAWTERGALMSYNSVLEEQVRRSAYIADKVLKGAKPADVPVEQPTKFELVVNLKTAKALGISIPQSVLLQASRVIE